MSYRNKTYVAFASEDIRSYYLMLAWRANANIDFNFYNAHDLYPARDSSLSESIKAQLRERIRNAKQVVLLGTAAARRKGGDRSSFLGCEIASIIKLNLPVVVANLDQGRYIDKTVIPQPLLDENYYTLSVSFQPAIIRFGLDGYVHYFAGKSRSGCHYYEAEHYKKHGLLRIESL